MREKDRIEKKRKRKKGKEEVSMNQKKKKKSRRRKTKKGESEREIKDTKIKAVDKMEFSLKTEMESEANKMDREEDLK